MEPTRKMSHQKFDKDVEISNDPLLGAMRRNEFLSNDDGEFNEITSRVKIGHLGLMDDRGYPRIVPLAFVAIGKNIYFHGATDGEKFELLSREPLATFSVDMAFAFIPSYWQSKRSAEPTSYFFKSLHIRGRGSVVKDLDKKAIVLQAMMEKYQPEGGYDKVETSNPIYKIPLQKVAVFEILADEFTQKLKFGQNYTDRLIEPIITGLEERNLPYDLETIKLIKKYRNQGN